jgi:DNA-binding response OmpR family regulator
MARVLVIDDEPDVRLLCRLNLEHAGHEVLEASDGALGLELARDLRPDAVVIDLMLPTIDGHQLLRVLDVQRTELDVPLLVLSAKAQETERMKSLRGGADAFVTKPFVPQLLVEELEALMAIPAPDRANKRAAQLAAAETGDTGNYAAPFA